MLDAGQEIDDDIERRRPGQPGSGRDSAVAEAHQTLILRGFAFHNAKAFGPDESWGGGFPAQRLDPVE